MATISVHEIKIRTEGFPGAPGWTTFYFDGDDTTQQANQFRQAKVFLDNVKFSFPTQWTGQVLAEGRLLLAATGFTENFTLAPADGTTTPVAGTGTAGFGAGVAGMCIGWRTDGVSRGRRVRGRTFLVPLSNGVYDIDGTLKAADMADLETFVDGWAVDTAKFGIWSRPRLGTGGSFHLVKSGNVRDKAAYLSSRRD